MSVNCLPGPAVPAWAGFSFLVFAGVVGLGARAGGDCKRSPSRWAVAAIGAAVAVAAAVFLLRRAARGPFIAIVACAGITAVGGSRSANPVWFGMLLVVGVGAR